MTKTTETIRDPELAIPMLPGAAAANEQAPPAEPKKKKKATKKKAKNKKTARKRKAKKPRLERATPGCQYNDLECDALRIVDWRAKDDIWRAVKSGTVKLCQGHRDKLERFR